MPYTFSFLMPKCLTSKAFPWLPFIPYLLYHFITIRSPQYNLIFKLVLRFCFYQYSSIRHPPFSLSELQLCNNFICVTRLANLTRSCITFPNVTHTLSVFKLLLSIFNLGFHCHNTTGNFPTNMFGPSPITPSIASLDWNWNMKTPLSFLKIYDIPNFFHPGNTKCSIAE